MPYEFEVVHNKRLIIKRVWGVYNDTEANESTSEFSRIDVHDKYDELHDLTAVTSYDVSTKTISSRTKKSVAAEDSNFLGKRVAIVVPSKLVHGMSRMYEAYHEGSKEEICIFNERQHAEIWLEAHDT